MHLTKTEKRIAEHLETFGSITSWEAIKEYGNTRLSATIHNLEKKGYIISKDFEESRNRYGDKIHFCRYCFVAVDNAVFDGKVNQSMI